MGFQVIFVVIALLAWADVAIVRQFRRLHAGPRWWTALSAAWLVGGGLGAWGAFFCEYQPSPRLRVFGAPVPAAFLHWEGPPGEEQWIDFVTPAPLLFAGANVVILALLAGCAVGMVFCLTRYRRQSGAG